MRSRRLQILGVRYQLWTLRLDVLQQVCAGARVSPLLDALLDLPELQRLVVPFASVPDLRSDNSCWLGGSSKAFKYGPSLEITTEDAARAAAWKWLKDQCL